MNRRTKPRNRTRKPSPRSSDAVQLLLHPEHDDYHDGWTAIRPRAFADLQSHEPQIVLTDQDEAKLRRLVQEHRPYIDPAMLTQLEAELNRALLVDEAHIPTDVVTMNSRVLYEDQDSGDLAETRLVYRHPMFRGESHVSVLAPIGAALLGLSVGQTITWPYGGRDALRLRIAALLYQPEAAGAAA